MDKIIGLKITSECQKCGSLIDTTHIAPDLNTLKFGLYGPEICKCGVRRKFKIVKLEQIELVERRKEDGTDSYKDS